MESIFIIIAVIIFFVIKTLFKLMVKEEKGNPHMAVKRIYPSIIEPDEAKSELDSTSNCQNNRSESQQEPSVSSPVVNEVSELHDDSFRLEEVKKGILWTEILERKY